ncbi:MAG TPA: metalloregulator ArsR/SmtB family transcription factor [Polyangiaceae bacterium]|nr:metalloregulator ArsR/SmtB family transcription factor [Polyangiaceae bacterium]
MPRSRSAAAQIADAAPLFAALGDETRLRLVTRLSAEGPQSIVKLTDSASVSRQAITKHLQALAGAGLVRSRREGRERVWELEAKRLNDARRYLDQISAHWDSAIDRLRALVEDKPPVDPAKPNRG